MAKIKPYPKSIPVRNKKGKGWTKMVTDFDKDVDLCEVCEKDVSVKKLRIFRKIQICVNCVKEISKGE